MYDLWNVYKNFGLWIFRNKFMSLVYNSGIIDWFRVVREVEDVIWVVCEIISDINKFNDILSICEIIVDGDYNKFERSWKCLWKSVK